MKGKEVLRIRNLSKTFKPFGKPEIKAVRGNLSQISLQLSELNNTSRDYIRIEFGCVRRTNHGHLGS